jgi:proline dehydrogenase
MARNPWLQKNLPRLPFARRAVTRFMPGEDAESALKAAADLRRGGIATIFTRLGENLTSADEATAVTEQYAQLQQKIEAAADLNGEISVKLTQLGLDQSQDIAAAHVGELARRVGKATLWLDMEGSAYTERTVALYERLKTTNPNLGICLQSYLRRTAEDLQRLLPLDPAIRLVKGAYSEPPAVAFQSRAEVDANYLAIAVLMLAARKAGKNVRIGLGTHDVRLIEQIAAHAKSLGLPRSVFEVQMLFGVRADEQRRLAREGFAVRVLISYGSAWYAWYMRRLAERPANVLFALRQLLPG